MITEDLKCKCLTLTSTFEGGWNAVAGNFDGQGLSFGPLQWNLGQGTLQPLLRDMADGGLELKHCCGEAFQQACLHGNIETFIQTHCLQDNGGVKPEWDRKLRALAVTRTARTLFVRAAEMYFRKAELACKTLGFSSERAFALCFDIAVQNGGVRKKHLQLYHARLSPQLTEEWQKLKLLAQVVADCASPRWRQDVLSRKLALALGGTEISGKRVHGHEFDLEQDFDIRYQRSWQV